jgi:hypothetical protein
MSSFESMSRRSVLKLMALASPAFINADALSALSPAATNRQNTQAHSRHPHLFYNAESLLRMKRMLAANPQADSTLKARSEQLLKDRLVPESVAEIGGGQQANYITPALQISDMGLTLGLLYQLTGEKRYAEKLREALLYYIHYDRWAGPQLIQRIPPWHSELDTATFSFGYAAGYDAIHDYLSEPDRKAIAGGLISHSALPILDDWILPNARIHSFESMGHNWWGVCVSGAGLCALALLGDDPRAQGWVDAVDAGYKQWFQYRGDVLQNRVATFERTGPSYEGVGYTNYGVAWYLQYRFAWQNTYPGRKAAYMEPLDGLARFFLHTLYPRSDGFYTVNFNDSSLESHSSTTLLLLIACGLGSPDAARYMRQAHAHPEGTLVSLLEQYPQPAAEGEASTSILYSHMGWAMMRSSWETDATLLAMKSGYTWNHAHADAGSFMLFHKGKPLIIDSGTCSYGRPEYTTYYRRSHAHNVILFNGEGQPKSDLDLGCKFPGRMYSLIDGLGLKYVYADATGPTTQWFLRNYRHWFWSGDVILVIDDLRARSAGALDWLLHFDGNYAVESNGAVRLTKSPAEVVVKILHPLCQHREETGLADHDPDKRVPYLAFRPVVQSELTQFFSVLCLNPSDMPTFELIQEPTYFGVRIKTSAAIVETYINIRAIETPNTQCVEIGGFTTDAYLLQLSRSARDGSINRFFVGDGSYLHQKGRSLMESLSKLTVCWGVGADLEVISDKGSSSIEIGEENPVRSARWNGAEMKVGFDAQRRLVALRR